MVLALLRLYPINVNRIKETIQFLPAPFIFFKRYRYDDLGTFLYGNTLLTWLNISVTLCLHLILNALKLTKEPPYMWQYTLVMFPCISFTDVHFLWIIYFCNISISSIFCLFWSKMYISFYQSIYSIANQCLMKVNLSASCFRTVWLKPAPTTSLGLSQFDI